MMHKYCLNIFLALFLSIIWSGFNSVLAQAPNITYPSPPATYPLNTTITPLVPNNGGGTVPANIYGQVTTFAGGRAPVSYDSNGTDAGFNLPSGITTDGAGNIYVSDYGSGAIRKITPAATVTTIANVTTPSGLILDQQGNIIVTDFQNNYLYKINTSGGKSIYAGTGSAGTNNGTITTAMFNNPGGMTVDATGNIYVADQQNNKIRKITPAGLVTTFTGSGSAGTTDNTGLAASFNNPDGLAIDKQGNLYVADTKNNLIRKITPAGVVTTFAGSGATGNSDGLGRAASFNYPTSIAIDASGNLYVTDYKSNLIRKIAPNGMVTTLAGNATVAKIDGIGKSASFFGPLGAVVNISGDLFVTDEVNYVIRKISITGYTIDRSLPSGLTFDPTTGTISGTPTVTSPATQYTITAYNKTGSSSTTITLAVGSAAPSAPTVTAPHIIYTTPQNYFVNTAITPLAPTNSGGAVPATIYGQVSTLAGSGSLGYANGTGAGAQFNIPYTMTGDATGNLYIADASNNAIRKVTPTGVVTTFAGSNVNGNTGGFVNGVGTVARFNNPQGIAVDASGNFFVGDYGNNAIRKITPAGVVSTFYQAPGAFGPTGVCFDNSGNLIVSAQDANQICSISPAGVLTIIAGSPATYVGYTNATGTAARFNLPEDVQVDASGNIYVADYLNNAVRIISPAGVVTTFAGSNVLGNIGSFADGVGTAARFNNLTGVALGSGNVIYVADLRNNDIRRIMPGGTVSLVAGSTSQAQGSANGTGTAASFFHPVDLYIDPTGTGYIADARNGMIRKIVLTGYTIDKPLPPGLTFNVTTGIITGTPTTISPPTQYTVTAYNGGGFSQSTITLTVRNQVVLPVARPHFSYTSPQVYTVAAPITPLGPTTTGGPVPATIFGSVSTFAGKNGTSGFLDATGTNAEFSGLWGIDIDASGNLYAADNIRIRKITPAAVVTSLAGGNPSNVSDGTGTAAGFNNIAGLTVSPSGNIFAGDVNNRSIRKITPGGTVTTFAGSSINLFNPIGVTSDPFGNLFVADQSNDIIREIFPDATSNVFAGNPTVIGSNDGPIAVATFNNPSDVKFDVSGNLYIADQNNNMIREISNTSIVSTVAGATTPGLSNGPLGVARFNKPSALATDPAGDIYITDQHNLVVRMINQLGEVVAVAGNNLRKISTDGTGGEANFYNAAGLVYTHGVLYATDQTCVRKIVVTGYTIEPSLPIGLNFDSATGVISGTPTSTSPATVYTITGYNEGGNYSTTVTISVIIPAPVITYPTPEVYTVNTPIAPLVPTNTGGAVTSYTADQPLPAGLTLDPLTGIISGTPTVVSPATNYTITASNSGGSGSFTINITVVAKVLTPQTITFNPIPQKTYGDADFDPGALSTNNAIPLTYTSDNTAVATIVNGNIHITGAGTATITASQAGNADFTTATPVTEELTVNKALLTITVRDETRVYGVPNPEFVITYTGFVYGETQAQLISPAQATTAANETSPPGEYPINISGEMSNNYSFNPIPGTLTIIAVSPNVVIPNAFTPNGDGYNDLWNIPALAGYPQCMVSIFNRYGGLIYQSRGYPSAWDGIYNGSQLPTGTYYYIIDLKNGTKPLSGYVALIR